MNRFFCFFCTVLLFSACQNDTFSGTESETLTGANTAPINHSISPEDAARLAADFVNDMKRKTRNNDEIGVASVLPWRYEDLYVQTRSGNHYDMLPDTMMYIVNFSDNQGFMLIPSDSRIQGVLAYVEQGNLTPTDRIENEGFKYFLDRLPDYYCEEFGRPVEGDTVTPPPPAYLDLWEIDSLEGPLLSTAWHQFAPFNDFCPEIGGEKTVAGCVAVATAQVVAYHQFPNGYNGHTYDWQKILTGSEPTTQAGKESVAHLVYDIGCLLNTTYGVNSSSASPSDIPDCLDSLGYSYEQSLGYSFYRCKQSIEDNCPILITGYDSLNNNKGHEWVIDGYAVRKYPLPFYDLATGESHITFLHQHLVHCNWGWRNTNLNGYYKSDVLDTRKKVTGTLTRSRAYKDCQIYSFVKPLEH